MSFQVEWIACPWRPQQSLSRRSLIICIQRKSHSSQPDLHSTIPFGSCLYSTQKPRFYCSLRYHNGVEFFLVEQSAVDHGPVLNSRPCNDHKTCPDLHSAIPFGSWFYSTQKPRFYCSLPHHNGVESFLG